ncbi:MAG: hypothetical protein GY853_14025 [PVC group bacterium]|nr:hypothetical protein [PVC group bacterium]
MKPFDSLSNDTQMKLYTYINDNILTKYFSNHNFDSGDIIGITHRIYDNFNEILDEEE